MEKNTVCRSRLTLIWSVDIFIKMPSQFYGVKCIFVTNVAKITEFYIERKNLDLFVHINKN